MNPRLFCRERTYDKALLLTYSFDPIFFEQVVLPDLWAGRSSEVLVLGDKEQIAGSMQTAVGQLWHLGKRYLLAGAKHRGAFHPKVVLRFGPRDGVVLLGSGNVTSSGWGGSRELGAAWMVGPDHADKGGWLHEFLEDALNWCDGDLERDAILRMKDVPWLSLTSSIPDEAGNILYSRQGRALGSALAARWAGRRFDEVKILTGSTDESGAFLRWASTTFGITRATVALTPASASFDPKLLTDLPLELRLIPAPRERPLHAKFYWFDGPGGQAAVMGSANCSAAAWLLSPERGGNVETLIVYDVPRADEFEDALSLFQEPSRMPVDVLLPRAKGDVRDVVKDQGYELTSLRWDSSTRSLIATLQPSPSAEMTVALILAGSHFDLRPSGTAQSEWSSRTPIDIGEGAAFASVKLSLGKESWTTSPRWINDIAALKHASLTMRFVEPFKGLERNTTSAEQRQMLDDLQEIAQALFNDSAAFRDQVLGSSHSKAKDDEVSAAPVNPNDLVFHLEDDREIEMVMSAHRPGGLSLTGMLHLFFDAEHQEEHGTSVGKGELNQGDGESPNGKKSEMSNKNEKVAEKPVPEAAIDARSRERLSAQIATFLEGLSSSMFAERCTATQMVQAVSFPLAVAVRGQARGWVSNEQAEKWSQEVFYALFRKVGHAAGGLLRNVEERYVESGQQATFGEVVGDGKLWVVLVATLASANWHGVGIEIDKAVALREVFTAPQLLKTAQREHVGALLGKVRIEDAWSYVTTVAPAAIRLLNDMEALLSPVWSSELENQMQLKLTQRLGDLLWRDKVGWAICLEEAINKRDQAIKVRLRGLEKNVMCGYYVNVTDLARRRADLSRLLEQLRAEVAVGD